MFGSIRGTIFFVVDETKEEISSLVVLVGDSRLITPRCPRTFTIRHCAL